MKPRRGAPSRHSGRGPGTPSPFRWGHLGWRLLPIAIVLGVTAAAVWRFVPVDDAYIAFRYAENLASGGGMVFNLGERVEGYSSLSWLLLLAAASALQLPVPGVAVGLGMLCGMATLLSLGSADAPAGPLAAVFTAAFLPFCYHIANGLETGLCVLLVSLLTASPLQGRGGRWALLIAAALLPWTRPEGFVLLLLWWGLWSALVRDGAAGWRHLAAALGGGAWLAQLIWRWAYFGEWIPNAARAKLLPLGLAWRHGLRDLASFAWAVGAWGLLLLAAFAVTWRAVRLRRSSAAAALTLAQAVFVVVAVVVLAMSGGDSFPLWRFYMPLVPTFFLVASRGLAMAMWRRPKTGAATVTPWLLAGGAILALWQPTPTWLKALAREASWVGHWRQIGERLRDALPPGSSIAVSALGAIPYYSRLRTIDILGLTDPHVARRPPDLRYWYPGHQRHDGPYVLARRPDLVILANGPTLTAPGPFRWQDLQPYEQDLASDPAFRRDYVLHHLPLRDGSYVQLFVRRGGRTPR